MHNSQSLSAIMHTMWVQTRPGDGATYSACEVEGCEEGSRGGGVCLKCATAELVALVGPALAARYGAAIDEVRETERLMRERIGDG